jgi:hypothetical protein
MDVAAYRRRYEAELAKAEKRPSEFRARLERSTSVDAQLLEGVGPDRVADRDDVAEALWILEHGEGSVGLRILAIQAMAMEANDFPEISDRLLTHLRDKGEIPDIRLAALDALQQISISSPEFANYRPAYLETLRSLVDDPNRVLRRRVIGILSREKDSYVQERLIAGLTGRSTALVSLPKAIQFLGYDIHTAPLGLIRSIAEDPPSQTAKREAVRVLAADPTSADLLARLLRDREEGSEVRRIAAAGLQSLRPEEFEDIARRIVLDETEDDDLRATCLSALGLRPSTGPGRDSELVKSVRQLEKSTASTAAKRAARAHIAESDANGGS